MLPKTFSEIEAMVGQTYGEGKDARTVTRITGLEKSGVPGQHGTVYWKRPGGKERRVGKYLPHFLQWVADQQRDRKTIENVGDIEDFTAGIPDLAELDGFIEQVDNQVTIKFTIK